MKKLVLFTLVVAGLAGPGSALASGVVLKVQPARHLVTVARTPASVALVHTQAASRLRVGQRVQLTARTLRNGTLSASRVTVVGRTTKVRFRALLLARSAGRIVVSAGGAVIKLRSGSTRTTASARDSAPPTGSQVDVTATVTNDDELDEDSVTVFSPTSPGGRIEGALTLGTGTITVTAEHLSLVLKVPAGFDLSSFTNGEDVLAEFAQQPDGSLVLTKLSGDDNAQEADDNGHDDGGSGSGSGGGGDD